MIIEIPEELEAGLAKIAEAKGIPLEDYLPPYFNRKLKAIK